MSVKIVLYDRKNYVIDSFYEPLYNFHEPLFGNEFLKECFNP